MNKCGYYSCYKGMPRCNHKQMNIDPRECDYCKRENGGIYPSQLPTVKLEDIGDVEIIDKRGNKLC